MNSGPVFKKEIDLGKHFNFDKCSNYKEFHRHLRDSLKLNSSDYKSSSNVEIVKVDLMDTENFLSNLKRIEPSEEEIQAIETTIVKSLAVHHSSVLQMREIHKRLLIPIEEYIRITSI